MSFQSVPSSALSGVQAHELGSASVNPALYRETGLHSEFLWHQILDKSTVTRLPNRRTTIMQTTPAHDWVSAVAERLQQRWRTVAPGQLDDLACDLWRDERLRSMEPEKAVDEWLLPVRLYGK